MLGITILHVFIQALASWLWAHRGQGWVGPAAWHSVGWTDRCWHREASTFPSCTRRRPLWSRDRELTLAAQDPVPWRKGLCSEWAGSPGTGPSDGTKVTVRCAPEDSEGLETPLDPLWPWSG